MYDDCACDSLSHIYVTCHFDLCDMRELHFITVLRFGILNFLYISVTRMKEMLRSKKKTKNII